MLRAMLVLGLVVFFVHIDLELIYQDGYWVELIVLILAFHYDDDGG